MRRTMFSKIVIAAMLFALLLAACDSSGDTELTTTSSLISSTSAPDVGATDDGDDASSTTTTLAGEAVSNHEVVLRESTDDGEILYVLVPPGDYTDVDLENFVGNLIENDEAVSSLEVFDDSDALTAFLLDDSEQTADDLVLIDEHHLLSLVERNRIIFRGPYAEMGEIVIGS